MFLNKSFPTGRWLKTKDAGKILDVDRLIEYLQALRIETLDILAMADQSRDSQLGTIAPAEAQLRFAAELFGQLDQMRITAVGVDCTEPRAIRPVVAVVLGFKEGMGHERPTSAILASSALFPN